MIVNNTEVCKNYKHLVFRATRIESWYVSGFPLCRKEIIDLNTTFVIWKKYDSLK